MPGTLLILHDSADFGGHERMLLNLMPGLIAARLFDRIVFVVPQANAKLQAALAPLAPAVSVTLWPFVKRRAEPYLARFRWRYRRAVARLIARERPATVLLVQGRIEHLAAALPALPATIRLVSYLPMAHTLATMGRSAIGDRVRWPLYRRPDAFIVPAAAVVTQLAVAGARSPVTVATNAVSPPARTAPAVARAALKICGDQRVALVLGRLDPLQKGLDRLLAAIARGSADTLAGWTFLVVGDGPGRAAIEAAVATSAGGIRLDSWTDRPDLYLSAADILLMPSRWEGLPLTMLEAMAYAVPVLASQIDAFAEFLPSDHLIDFAGDDLFAAMDRVTTPAARARFAEHARVRLAPLTLAAARAAFVEGMAPARERSGAAA